MEHEWRVRWKRESWYSSQSRVFQRKGPALRLVRRLYGNDPRFDGLAPLEYVTIELRSVGEWQPQQEEGN